MLTINDLHVPVGQPVKLTVADQNGVTREESVPPRFATPFSGELNFAGLPDPSEVPGALRSQLDPVVLKRGSGLGLPVCQLRLSLDPVRLAQSPGIVDVEAG